MADNSTFAATAELARTEAFVKANRATKCRRETCGETMNLDKRGLCVTHARIREASLRQDAVNLAERPVIKQAITISSLLSGPSGFAQVSGADLNHCNSALSARASLGETLKKLEQIERFLMAAPQSNSGWQNYEFTYSKIEGFVRQIKHHEAAVKDSFPDLVCAKIFIPPRLERAQRPAWLEV